MTFHFSKEHLTTLKLTYMEDLSQLSYTCFPSSSRTTTKEPEYHSPIFISLISHSVCGTCLHWFHHSQRQGSCLIKYFKKVYTMLCLILFHLIFRQKVQISFLNLVCIQKKSFINSYPDQRSQFYKLKGMQVPAPLKNYQTFKDTKK